VSENDLIVYYSGDWVPVMLRGRVRVCPTSIWGDPQQRAEWIRTGIIPDNTPELKRICKITNVGVPDSGKEAT
jgi:hypothetical protein